MIQAILWDIDGTLLDFAPAERAALRACFQQFGLGPCPDEQIARYAEINRTYWRRLERGELTKPQILVGRFQDFFAAEGIACPDIEAFNLLFQRHLGETVVFRDHGDQLICSLKGTVLQYAVTNGTCVAQRRKLEKSGLSRLLDRVFISEEVGAEKPDPRFFDAVFSVLGEVPRDQVLIVGDSLTSDMQGGRNASIRCCWYNPQGETAPPDLSPDFIIQNLEQVRDILAQENGTG
ncbi:MAG: noncanonical pyrimidine nucleotidase, YjjG family [Lawsonibacter sp.]|nr:noncanonical pyrimidine nucleotidase, YjjG family [Lawsonibacter sp.]